MKGQIILIPITTVRGETFFLTYKTLKKACIEHDISYNTVTTYFRRNPTETSYFNKATGLTLTKTALL
jgi:hypothetical protein